MVSVRSWSQFLRYPAAMSARVASVFPSPFFVTKFCRFVLVLFTQRHLPGAQEADLAKGAHPALVYAAGGVYVFIRTISGKWLTKRRVPYVHHTTFILQRYQLSRKVLPLLAANIPKYVSRHSSNMWTRVSFGRLSPIECDLSSLLSHFDADRTAMLPRRIRTHRGRCRRREIIF